MISSYNSAVNVLLVSFYLGHIRVTKTMDICLCVILLPLTRWFVFSFVYVCLFVSKITKKLLADCTKFDGKVAHGARKKP